MKTMIALVMTVAGSAAMAASGGHAHDPHHIPTDLIFWQVFNLTILFGALIYFLRQPVKDFFRQRQAGFVEASQKSQAARQEAEKQYLELKHKIERLESTRAETLARAEAEAADLRRHMLKEADEMASRIRHEAQVTAQIEVQRARQDLRESFIDDSIAAARQVLAKDIGSQDHSKLQTDFVKNIEAVNQ
ncbi:MAG: ATP synthase F0 subunit B [Bdellovibrionaceae bacterium]|nr:ATP synthase F0 subunit B [Pseudobdellovibrionaceae bacterium]MBX3033642.1 ATP synthase F0 subunit B [Pseudobdellovibrionaceae bacterium]